jgi:hypothetical protein
VRGGIRHSAFAAGGAEATALAQSGMVRRSDAVHEDPHVENLMVNGSTA